IKLTPAEDQVIKWTHPLEKYIIPKLPWSNSQIAATMLNQVGSGTMLAIFQSQHRTAPATKPLATEDKSSATFNETHSAPAPFLNGDACVLPRSFRHLRASCREYALYIRRQFVRTDPEHPRNLIPELLRQFYHMDWVTGTGGGISIKHGNEIFIAPSGVHKERVKPEDLFVCDINGVELCCPSPKMKIVFRRPETTPLTHKRMTTFLSALTQDSISDITPTHARRTGSFKWLGGCQDETQNFRGKLQGLKHKLSKQNRRYARLPLPLIRKKPDEVKESLPRTK
ncbi:Methylthioribulose-1-phosphate dehydratase, partial [Paramuricea clavata]